MQCMRPRTKQRPVGCSGQSRAMLTWLLHTASSLSWIVVNHCIRRAIEDVVLLLGAQWSSCPCLDATAPDQYPKNDYSPPGDTLPCSMIASNHAFFKKVESGECYATYCWSRWEILQQHLSNAGTPYHFQHPPPICSWWTSSVSPSDMSS